MTETVTARPPLRRARYVLHMCSVAGAGIRSGLNREGQPPFPVIDLGLIRLLDEVLDLFDNEPRFQHFTLDGQVLPVEDYLAIRPENFERVESAVQDGQLLIGPWYVVPREGQFHTEALIRNLMLGLRTASVFGRPMRVGYLPHMTELPPQLPQIFKSFGINTAILGYIAGKPLVEAAKGVDGTQILVSYAATLSEHSATDLLDEAITIRGEMAPYSESGHMLLLQKWSAESELLQVIPEIQRRLHDNAFHSNPAAYVRAVEVTRDAASMIVLENDREHSTNVLWLIGVEALLAWVDQLPVSEGEEHLRNPRVLMQRFWKDYLRNDRISELADGAGFDLLMSACNDIVHAVIPLADKNRATKTAFNMTCHPVINDQVQVPPFGFAVCRTDPRAVDDSDIATLEAELASMNIALPFAASVMASSETAFEIIAVKLPEDAEGLIVRGENMSDTDVWVTLTPFRPYEHVEVVTMDEAPIGGILAPESNGAVRCKAGPHRILTFWFHD